MIDAFLTRRISGELSPLIVEFIVVPRGETGALTTLDTGIASIRDAISRLPVVGVRTASADSLGAMGLAIADRFGENYGRDFHLALEQDWIPLPQSPSLRTMAAGTLLASATGISITSGDFTIGFAGESNLAIVVAIAILVTEPMGAVAEDLSRVVREHLAAALDRKISERDGIRIHSANRASESKVLPSRPPRIVVTPGSQPPTLTGQYSRGNQKLHVRLLITNDCEFPVTLLPAKGTTNRLTAMPFLGFENHSDGSSAGRPMTWDFGAQMAAELDLAFTLPEPVDKGTAMPIEIEFETSRSDVPPARYEILHTA